MRQHATVTYLEECILTHLKQNTIVWDKLLNLCNTWSLLCSALSSCSNRRFVLNDTFLWTSMLMDPFCSLISVIPLVSSSTFVWFFSVPVMSSSNCFVFRLWLCSCVCVQLVVVNVLDLPPFLDITSVRVSSLVFIVALLTALLFLEYIRSVTSVLRVSTCFDLSVCTGCTLACLCFKDFVGGVLTNWRRSWVLLVSLSKSWLSWSWSLVSVLFETKAIHRCVRYVFIHHQQRPFVLTLNVFKLVVFCQYKYIYLAVLNTDCKHNDAFIWIKLRL